MENWCEREPRSTTDTTTPSGNEDCAVVEGMPPEVEKVLKQHEPLSPWSKAFHDPLFNLHVLAIFGSQTPLDETRGKEVIRQVILKHPRFSCIVVGDKRDELKWVRLPKIKFDDHLIVPIIDDPTIKPGSKMADKYVDDYLHNLSKERFDMSSRPLWDLHFLKLKTSNAEGIIIFRAHHSLGDGASLMALLLACSRNVFNPTALPIFPVSKKKKEGDNGRLGGRHCMSNCLKVVLVWLWWNIVVLIWNTSVDCFKLLATLFFLKDTNTPIKGKRSGAAAFRQPRRFVCRTICLDDIKLVKNMMNVTINDVAIGITQAGLSYYLNRKYSDYNHSTYYKADEIEDGVTIEKKMKNKLPKNIRLRSIVTVNLRPQGIQDFAENIIENDSKPKWGNMMSLFLLPFNIGFHDDPLDYVREAKVTADRRKHSLEPIFTFFGLKIIPLLFGMKVENTIIERVCANTTLTFSNVVGPTEEILFCGHRINVIAATLYGQTQASMITFTSCGNQMALVASVDEDTISDPQQLCDDIIESLRLIKEAVVARYSI